LSKKKPKYSDDFKLEAVRMSEPSAHSVAEVARLLGIKPKKLALWHAQYGHEGDDQYPRNIISRLEKEVSSLRAENKSLRLQCAQMKRALSFTSVVFKLDSSGDGE